MVKFIKNVKLKGDAFVKLQQSVYGAAEIQLPIYCNYMRYAKLERYIFMFSGRKRAV